MRNSIRIITGLFALAFFTLGSLDALGQNANANPRAFGVGQPKSIDELPPGQFKRSLKQLPPQAQATALRWLQGFEFPVEDVDSLRTSSRGAIYYADFGLARALDVEATAEPGDFIAQALPDADLFTLHSKPGSSNVLYLDFDGHVITGTQWNDHPTYGTGINSHPALPFDPSGNDSPPTVANFTDTERERIHEIWHRIAEDFAPFDIDVTTEEPSVFTRTTGRVLFTHDTDANGNAMPSQGAGGVAWINVFGNSNYVSDYSPALVYYTNLYTNRFGDAGLNAEAGSHEFGHNIGLSHDGHVDGTSYYAGHGSGNVRWGPIMGGSYQDQVTQWSKGEYSGANNQQDDINLIAGDLGYDPDREGDTPQSAVRLEMQSNGNILVTNPETDPVVYDQAGNPGVNKGIIQDESDVDWWYLDVGAGTVNLVATPAWRAFNYSPYITAQYRGANLDIDLELYDSALNLVDFDEPVDDTDAGVSATVAAGRYYLRVDGVGNAIGEGYSDYASIGMYFIEGTAPPPVSDTDPPNPNPMGWAVEPYATGYDSIAMTAATAADPTGPVEYLFTCVAGGANCSGSGWQTARSWTATGLDSSTTYTFTVTARDALNNQTAPSPQRSATTPTPPPQAPGNFTAVPVSTTEISLGWDDVAGETGYELQRSTDGAAFTPLAAPAADATGFDDAGLTPGTQYWYRLRAVNAVGESSWTTATAVTTDLPPAAPSDLAVTGASENSITIAWTDNANNETSFQVHRSGDGVSWSLRATLGAGTTGWTDSGLGSLETWFYRVRATNSGGASAWSNTAEGTTTAECDMSKTLAPGAWYMLALPCQPLGGDTVADLVDGDLSGLSTGAMHVIRIENETRGATPLRAGDTMAPGWAYFVFARDGASIRVKGAHAGTTDMPLWIVPGAGEPNLNYLGYTGSASQAWADLVPMENGRAKNWDWADDFDNRTGTFHCDMKPVGSKCRIRRIFHKFNGSGFDPYDLDGPAAGVLEPWDVALVQSFDTAASLRVPAASSAPAAESPAARPGNRNARGRDRVSSEWHVRLVAESGRLRDRQNFLGQLDDARDEQDGRDLEEMAPFGFPYLGLTFENPAFADTQWGYATDFRAVTGRMEGSWTFVVRSAGVDEVTLRWQAPAGVLERARLVDDATGETLASGGDGRYTYTATGGERRFRMSFD